MKHAKIMGMMVGLCACLMVGSAQAADFYDIFNVTTDTVNFFSEFNLIEGPGVGFDASSPHDAAGTGLTWVTDGPCGDYLSCRPAPIIELDLGQDQDLVEISTWGYASTNANGVKEFSLRFATDAEGPGGYGTSITYNPTFNIPLDLVPRHNNPFSQTITARYVEFTALDNHWGNPQSIPGGDRVGLGEIAFSTTVAPLLDLQLQVDRMTGNITLSNPTADTFVISGYDMLSADGALDPDAWDPIAPDDGWLEFGATHESIAEGTLGTLDFTPSMSINLGDLWIQNLNEDVSMDILLSDGTKLNPKVVFTGNDDASFDVGDLNFDGEVDELDWPTYRDNYREDLSSLSAAQAYQKGDLNYDGENNRIDFVLFKTAYDEANGPGSFDAMVAGIPEPATWLLLLLGGLAIGLRRIRIGHLAVPAILLAVVVLGMTSAQATLPSLVSNWTLDADGSDSVGANNGTPNAVTFGQAGANANTGTAALFDGSTSTITVPYSADLNPASFSVTIWANTAATGSGHHSPITSRDDVNVGQSTHGYVIYNDPNGEWIFMTGPGDSAWVNLSGGSVTTDTWTHLAITFDADSNTKSIYVDGVLAGSVSDQDYSVNGTVESEDLHIGSGQDNGLNFYFDGLIDDVAVYNGVLNTAEIQNVMNNGVSAFAQMQRLTLEVNTVTGATSLRNNAGVAMAIDQYEILSEGNALNVAGWNSLEDQDYEEGGDPQDPPTGDGWEQLGTPVAGFVGEAYLQGSSNLVDATTINLGSLFNTAGPQDLSFSYRMASGAFEDGIVEYVTNGYYDADFDADGDVDGADFLTWQRGFGMASPEHADGDANGDTNVDGADLGIWEDQFGTGGAAGAAVSAVPEPSTLGLLGLALVGLACGFIRHHQGGQTMHVRKMNLLFAVVAVLAIAPVALAGYTLDRQYRMGDDPLDGASDGVVVGLVTDSFVTDDVGFGDQQDLYLSSWTATWVNVGSDGLERPGALAGEWGIQFNGADSYLAGDRLGAPYTSAASTTLDYSGIVHRGIQGWVYPTAPGAGVQDIIMDTRAHGVRISDTGTWVMRYWGPVGQDFDTGIAVTADTWHHVQVVRAPRDGTPNRGSTFYLNGVAIAFALDGYYDGDSDTPLVLGANSEDGADVNTPNPYSENFFTGVLDEVELFINGTSTGTPNIDYLDFDVATDNPFVANSGWAPGDITGDGNVTGDGSGNPSTDDVSAFVQNWKVENLVMGSAVGDLNSRALGDFNYDGIVDLFDWHVLRTNHEGGANLNLGELLAGVPEPSTFVLFSLCAAIALSIRRRR